MGEGEERRHDEMATSGYGRSAFSSASSFLPRRAWHYTSFSTPARTLSRYLVLFFAARRNLAPGTSAPVEPRQKPSGSVSFKSCNKQENFLNILQLHPGFPLEAATMDFLFSLSSSSWKVPCFYSPLPLILLSRLLASRLNFRCRTSHRRTLSSIMCSVSPNSPRASFVHNSATSQFRR